MVQSPAFNGGKNFALGSRVTFGSLDCLTTATVDPNMPITTCTGPTRSAKSKAEKRRLKRHTITLKWCLNRLADAVE